MPPCAETVWERVGKTFESNAQDRPCSEICSAARMPAPPAPITTASNSRTGIVTYAPHKINRPEKKYPIRTATTPN